jgi:hypothetical protein
MGGKYLGGDDSNGLAAGLGTSGAGLALRMIGNRRATADINRIRELISQRNPLYQARVAVNPMVPGPGSPLAAKAVRDAATNAILAQARPRVNIDTTDWE